MRTEQNRAVPKLSGSNDGSGAAAARPRTSTGDGRRVAAEVAGYLLPLLGVAIMTGLIAVVPGADHTGNISLLYLLVVMGAAYYSGRGPAVTASLLAVLSFDWFFVEPRYTFTVNHPDEWLALGVFLVTAVVFSHLTTTLHAHAAEARQREQETAALAKASWAVASQVNHQQALAEVLRRLTEVTGSEAAAIVVRGANDTLEIVASHDDSGASEGCLPNFDEGPERAAMEVVLREGGSPGWGDEEHKEHDVAFLRLALENRVLGVLYLRWREKQTVSAGERRVVEALANHAAVSLERYRLTQAEAQAQALAEADRLKTALLAMMSHDFRSPLTSIKTSVTGLLQDGLPWDAEAQRELLTGIDEETDRLNAMVGNILALSRLEAGAWRPQCEAVSLAEVIGVALDAFSVADNERIHVNLDNAPPEAWLDMIQIVQVLHNLLDNALKYSPSDTPVHLCARRQENLLVIEVMDAGEGLAPGEEQLIFERFYRAPRWRESSLSGTGIGLAVCYGLVEAHGGRLSASNRDEGGARFQFTLPLSPTRPATKTIE